MHERRLPQIYGAAAAVECAAVHLLLLLLLFDLDLS